MLHKAVKTVAVLERDFAARACGLKKYAVNDGEKRLYCMAIMRKNRSLTTRSVEGGLS